MDKEQAVALLERALAQLPQLRQEHLQSPGHVAWVQSTGLDLARIFGPDSIVTLNFSRISYQATGSFMVSMWDHEAEMARHNHDAYLLGLDLAEGVLVSGRAQLEDHGVDRLLRNSRVRSDGARVFVSHGTESKALAKLERYLIALGTQPVVVVRGPSQGMSVDDLVEKRMGESDCVVVLATADEEVGGRRQPRPNVLHEMGLAQEKHPERIVYLKEEGCDFPSNVKPKVWGDFTQDNMEGAFEKVAKELHAMELL